MAQHGSDARMPRQAPSRTRGSLNEASGLTPAHCTDVLIDGRIAGGYNPSPVHKLGAERSVNPCNGVVSIVVGELALRMLRKRFTCYCE